MKKVLLLIPSFFSYYLPVRDTFIDLGWKVKSFDYRRGDLGIRVYRFLPVIGGFDKASKKIEEKIIRLVKTFKPDIVLTVKGESLSRDLLLKLRRMGCVTVNWFPDPINWWQFIKDNYMNYDFFFHFDPYIINKLKKLGAKNVFYLPFAEQIDESVKAKTYEISFIGTYSPYRERILSSLKYYDLNIWGDQWNQSSLKKFVKGGRVKQKKMKSIVKKSRINLNIFYDFKSYGANLRVFEVLGWRGFLLSEYITDLDKLFNVGQDLETFRNSKELVKKVKFYLKNESVREKIINSGFNRMQHEHNYLIRIEQMLSMIESHRLKNNTKLTIA